MTLYRVISGSEKRNLETGFLETTSSFPRYTSFKSSTFTDEIDKLAKGKFFFCELSDAIKFFKTVGGDKCFIERPEIFCFDIPNDLVSAQNCGIGRYTYEINGLQSIYSAITILLSNDKIKGITHKPIGYDKFSSQLEIITNDEYVPYYEKDLKTQLDKYGIDFQSIIDNNALGMLCKKLGKRIIGEIVYGVVQRHLARKVA